jgi:hypothetical protein
MGDNQDLGNHGMDGQTKMLLAANDGEHKLHAVHEKTAGGKSISTGGPKPAPKMRPVR